VNLKSSVLCGGLHPKLVEAMCKVSVVYSQMGINGVRACITSVLDSRHSSKSLHYKGRAFDVRTWIDGSGTQMSVDEKNALARVIRDELGDDFDVVVEATHLHIEYDV
jgi:hypothetical protein